MIARWHRLTAVLLLALFLPLTAAASVCLAHCEAGAALVTNGAGADRSEAAVSEEPCSSATLCVLAATPALSGMVQPFAIVTGTLLPVHFPPAYLPAEPVPPPTPPAA